MPDCPVMLVLAPTRELAMQVAATCRLVRKLTGLRTACVFGGVPKEQQAELLQKKPHIVVATPGRLLDLVDDGVVTLKPGAAAGAAAAPSGSDGPSATGVAYVVLDEADKMLSLGFQAQLERLRSMVLPAPSSQAVVGAAGTEDKKKKKAAGKAGASGEAAAGAQGSGSSRPQVLLFTATMPQEVASAAAQWLLPGATKVQVSASAASISKTVTQVVQVCAEHKKPAKLLKHLAAIKDKAANMRNFPRVLVFANRIKTVRFLHDTLAKESFRVVMLHGERSQPEREEAMRDFKSGKAQVMVATDVAARGLDIRLLPYVVNYDFPSRLETYIHRVGRTGRLAAYGHAYSFFTRNLARIAGPLVQLLQEHEQGVDPNLVQLAEAWKQAEAQLGPEALAKAAAAAAGSEDGEEGPESGDGAMDVDDLIEARMAAADLNEGLGKKVSAAGKKDKKGVSAAEGAQEQPAAKKQKAAGEGVEAGKAPSLQQRLEARKAEGVAVAKAKEAEAVTQLAFVPAPKWQGPRPGYFFSKGTLGLGYYLDNKAPKKSKAGGKAGVLQQQQQQQKQPLKGKGPIIPVQRRKGLDRFDDSDSDDDAFAAAAHEAAKDADKKAAAGGGAGKVQHKKALPGRLRKKLAKERQGKGA